MKLKSSYQEENKAVEKRPRSPRGLDKKLLDPVAISLKTEALLAFWFCACTKSEEEPKDLRCAGKHSNRQAEISVSPDSRRSLNSCTVRRAFVKVERVQRFVNSSRPGWIY